MASALAGDVVDVVVPKLFCIRASARSASFLLAGGDRIGHG
jgi:hypothetical protein